MAFGPKKHFDIHITMSMDLSLLRDNFYFLAFALLTCDLINIDVAQLISQTLNTLAASDNCMIYLGTLIARGFCFIFFGVAPNKLAV